MQSVIEQEFGCALKFWRNQRKTSQLDLALAADISQRHISFLETGRSQPSREMVLHLAQVLDVPLRERNGLLRMAGYAPAFQQRSLAAGDMQVVQQALDMTLAHHAPFPAIVIDRHWNLLQANESARAWLGLMGDADALWPRVDGSGNHNVYRLTFHPEGLRPMIKNWMQVRGHLLARLQAEVEQAPADKVLRALLEDVRALDRNSVAAHSSATADHPQLPVIPMQLELDGVALSMFSMISTFGTAQDVTAEELRIESFFPADTATKVFFEHLNRQDA